MSVLVYPLAAMAGALTIFGLTGLLGGSGFLAVYLAGLVVGNLELSEDGKAMKYFAVTDFDLHLTPSSLAEAAQTLTTPAPDKGPQASKE